MSSLVRELVYDISLLVQSTICEKGIYSAVVSLKNVNIPIAQLSLKDRKTSNNAMHNPIFGYL